MPFRDLIGHQRLVGLLSRSVRRQSLPPSLVFTGPSGVGKRVAAVAVAQALNCLAPNQSEDQGGRPFPIVFDACGSCASCARIARGVHPDVPLVQPGDNGSIRVDEIRDVVERAGYRPFEGRRRVVIVDDADEMVPAAQNALLKTLEEPPSASSFILITSRPDRLLPTVRSRCPRLHFHFLAEDEISGVLTRRGRSEAEARTAAAAAGGSLGVALSMIGGGAEDLVEARAVAERVLVEAGANEDPRARIETAKQLLVKTGAGGAADREQLASHLHAMASLIRDVELLSSGADAGALANPDVQSSLDRLIPVYRGDRGVRAFASVDQALVALDGNAGVKIVADWLVLQL